MLKAYDIIFPSLSAITAPKGPELFLIPSDARSHALFINLE
jgi:hypothetical protein